MIHQHFSFVDGGWHFIFPGGVNLPRDSRGARGGPRGVVGMDGTLPETNSSPLKMDSWKMKPSFWVSAHFQGRTVSFREGNYIIHEFDSRF